jgi:membrane-associated phospholipid phosphatase
MTSATPTSAANRPLLLFVVSGVLAVFFVGWTWLVLDPAGSLVAFDKKCAQFWKEHGMEQTPDLIVYLTDLGGIATNSMVAIMGAVWQFSHGRRFFGTAWFAIVFGGAIGNQMLKITLDRDRPPEHDRAVLETNKSYPSGHAQASAVGYGMLCYALLRQSRFPFRRTIIATFFVVLIAAIGFSRIYLRAHWFSDVIGGWAVGLCWLCLCLGWLERRRARVTGTAGPESALGIPQPVTHPQNRPRSL